MKRHLKQYRSWLGIGLAALALTIWVISGDDPPPERASSGGAEAVKVTLITSRARPTDEVMTLQGHVEPEQIVRMRAKTSGEVAETPVEEGTLVGEEALVARLDLDDREARLQEAWAGLSRAQGDYRAARRLAEKGFQAELEAERARADLEAAKARVASIELDIEHTRIRAPIEGVLNALLARRGDYVATGDPVAEIVDNDPLRAVVQVPQHRITDVREGQPARVRFLDDIVREGEVTYISSAADPETRTFRARIQVANPERDLPAGISVTVEIPVQSRRAHPVSPALVSLGESGELGIKVGVRDNGEWRARFLPVEPIKADARRLWVSGLPEEIRLITRGQGFVRDGDRIDPVPEASQ